MLKIYAGTPFLRTHVSFTPPGGGRRVQLSERPLRHGYQYFTRHDGAQFEAGEYLIDVVGETAFGEVAISARLRIELADSSLPSGEPPALLTGTDRQPIAD